MDAGDRGAAKGLLEIGADPAACDAAGETALHKVIDRHPLFPMPDPLPSVFSALGEKQIPSIQRSARCLQQILRAGHLFP